MKKKFLIIGAGFSGCVLANRLVNNLDCTVEIWDERNHIGGNCHTKRDEETGIMVHTYGPHIFNTDKKEIWDFINGFSEFRPYVHRVKAVSEGKLYSMPVNLSTINQFFNKTFTPAQAEIYLQSLADASITNPQNFEEQALSFIGRDLYKAFFYGYTKKQWGCEPSALPASILKRIPVRFNYDDNYHNNIYTGIPADGYTNVMDRMTASAFIDIIHNKKYLPAHDVSGFNHVFYTGPLDAYFSHCYGRLGYRTVVFEKEMAMGDYQGTAQVNYCDADIAYTRITEHKHFTPWEQHEKTIYFKEYSIETGKNEIPYYPKCLDADKLLLARYRLLAEQLNNTSFLGRLATYRYMDMHHVIGESLAFAEKFILHEKQGTRPPVFLLPG